MLTVCYVCLTDKLDTCKFIIIDNLYLETPSLINIMRTFDYRYIIITLNMIIYAISLGSRIIWC